MTTAAQCVARFFGLNLCAVPQKEEGKKKKKKKGNVQVNISLNATGHTTIASEVASNSKSLLTITETMIGSSIGAVSLICSIDVLM